MRTEIYARGSGNQERSIRISSNGVNGHVYLGVADSFDNSKRAEIACRLTPQQAVDLAAALLKAIEAGRDKVAA